MSDISTRQRYKQSEDRFWLLSVDLALRNGAVEAELQAIKQSRSWQLTAPLRKFMAWLEKKRGNSWQPTPLAPARQGAEIDLPYQGDAYPDRPMQRWLVDITDLATHQFHAGVQRVSRRILSEWLIHPPAGVIIEPVRLTQAGRYCHARQFLSQFVGKPPENFGEDVYVDLRDNDKFIGLDLLRDYVDPYQRALAEFHSQKIPIYIVVHDVLPLSHPQWFPEATGPAFENWFAVVAKYADRLLCISQTTRESVKNAMEERKLEGSIKQPIVISLGADLLEYPYVAMNQPNVHASSAFRVITVGTVEVRKGHADILDALDKLWAQGNNLYWTIVGATGWGVDALIPRIVNHPQWQKRLWWYPSIGDAELIQIYRQSDLLVSASYGEGFGLPIVEAGQLGLPLLLRDIPIFHEVAGKSAAYFAGRDTLSLTDALQAIISNPHSLSKNRWPTWCESAQQLAEILDQPLQ